MSQMSAGSRTDVGAYHRDDNEATEKHLGDLSGQFSLMDHRTASEVSWCMKCFTAWFACWLDAELLVG
jgi:hypothetical protein